MPVQKKSYATVTVDADGGLPVPAGVVEDFGIKEGDLGGLKKLPGGKWELTFWRQLRPKGCRPTKSPQAPDYVAITQKLHPPMTKLVAVGDIHHGPNLEQIEAAIEREQPDLTVFVGDYFDQFHDHYDHARRTAIWLKQSLAKPNRVHLWGNHDLPYGFSEYAYCPGYDPAKERAIRSVLDEQDWAKLKLWHLESRWLFTHAGLSLPYALTDTVNLRDYLRTEEKRAWAALTSREPHWFWSVGMARGGFTPVGGLLWCDWEREFKPVPGLNQVLGHTPARTFRVMHGPSSENWCIDVTSMTGITHILAIDDSGPRPVEV